jgi:hypothetical protein
MEMLRTSGYFLAITPANNQLGHGFYQFSPELFFRIFSPDNGFDSLEIFAFEDLPAARWYRVQDPDTIKQRVTLVNARPTYLGIIARKHAVLPVFTAPPYQSDYEVMWKADKHTSWGSPLIRWKWLSNAAGKLVHYVPPSMHNVWRRFVHWRSYVHGFHKAFFSRVRVP